MRSTATKDLDGILGASKNEPPIDQLSWEAQSELESLKLSFRLPSEYRSVY